ncbi:HAD-IIA family hydrolase [Nocardioides campestrisoli]|uniref:HAD-IIA family hydrolase n=1 Tax=Nocardioides campestrisoli TaxID=2736757 RepID=UPI00163D51A5|nr:HAD-IIA family hydrolase [Nocardioides campestrisoli]
MLQEAPRPLLEAHDLVMFDLDGVVYIGEEAVAGVPARLVRLQESGVRVAFVTNNASRTPEEVAARLQSMQVQASPQDVVTSAQAASSVLVERFGTGAGVLVLGGPGLWEATRAAGLVPLDPSSTPDQASALVTGYGPDVLWREVMRVAVAVRDGLPWVASNTDMTIPTAFGVAPGHGVQVRMLEEFTGVSPVVAGKPAAPLLEETVARVGGTSPLMVGDRLDTDIAGARALGLPSLLVLTGVTGLSELVSATAEHRPTFVAPTLEGLFEPHPVPTAEGEGFGLGGWHGQVRAGALTMEGAGSEADWWRTVAVTAWQHADATGEVAETTGLCPPSP